MDGPFKTRRARRRLGINITPLVDVMFILIIFFTVSSTFRSHLGVDVMLPRAATGVEEGPGNYEITVDASGNLFWGGQRVDATTLHAALQAVLQREPEATLVLRGDEAAPFQAVVTAMDIARQAGGGRLIIPTRFQNDPGEE